MHTHTHEHANILALRDATISLHELTERPLATFDALRDAPLKLPCTEEQWPKPCQTVCRLPPHDLDSTATEQAANAACGAAARRQILGSGSDLEGLFLTRIRQLVPRQCDIARAMRWCCVDCAGRRDRPTTRRPTFRDPPRTISRPGERAFASARWAEPPRRDTHFCPAKVPLNLNNRVRNEVVPATAFLGKSACIDVETRTMDHVPCRCRERD